MKGGKKGNERSGKRKKERKYERKGREETVKGKVKSNNKHIKMKEIEEKHAITLVPFLFGVMNVTGT